MKINKDLEGKTCLMRHKTMFNSINELVFEIHVIRISPSGGYIEYRKAGKHDTSWEKIEKIDILDVLE